MKIFVVKVQVAIAGEPGILIYDSSSQITKVFEFDPDFKLLPKSYWWAELDSNGMLNLTSQTTEKEYNLYPFGAIRED